MKYRTVRVHDRFYVEEFRFNKYLVRAWRRISPRGGFGSKEDAGQWWAARKLSELLTFEVVQEWSA